MSKNVLQFEIHNHREGHVAITSPTGAGSSVDRGRIYPSRGPATVHLQILGVAGVAEFLADTTLLHQGARSVRKVFSLPYSKEAEDALGLGQAGRRL